MSRSCASWYLDRGVGRRHLERSPRDHRLLVPARRAFPGTSQHLARNRVLQAANPPIKRVCSPSRIFRKPQGPYGIRTRAAAVRGRCPRPLDEWAVRRGSVANRAGTAFGSRPPHAGGRYGAATVVVSPSRPSIRLLEAAADVLAGREHRVVAGAAWRELHDPHRFVAIAVTACVRGRLVERAQAIASPREPGHPRTPTTSGAPWEPGLAAGSRTLQTKRGGEEHLSG